MSKIEMKVKIEETTAKKFHPFINEIVPKTTHPMRIKR
jgi:hypothetical protein